ncbi:MAG: sugar ABC transporter ATP-binding protein [Solirubrobacterales bacterium]|nr:sugar ABC transporter ATP-binding protein [Solirubrobacterales bacterium]
MSDPRQATGPALEVRGVSKTFPGHRVLHDVDLRIEPGEVHALLGENGSGKSTLIKILSGFHPSDPGGEVAVAGRPLALGSPTASAAAGLRFVHQRLAIIPELNAVENVALEAGYSRGGLIDWADAGRYTRELLGRLDVDIDIWRPMGELRAVDRSSVAIARAVRDADEPISLVVLDEPTASLPEAEVRHLFELIRELTASGVAVLYVSHRLDEIFEIADRVSVLRDGHLQGTEPIAGLTRERLVAMIVGDAAAADYEAFVRAAPADPGGAPLLGVAGLAAGRIAALDLDVAAGEIVGVVGIAGSGREDVARALVGALPRERGTVAVGGEALPPDAPGAALEAGMMLGLGNTQPNSALREFTVRENVTLPSLRRYAGIGRIRRRREWCTARDWVEALDIRPAETERRYDLLSGGNQQKTILAKCLDAEPRVLVLDEPTAGVDVGARRAIYELLAREADRGLAVVVCSSDYEDVVSVCDRAVVLRGGRVAARIDRERLSEHDLLLAATGGSDDDSGPGERAAGEPAATVNDDRMEH